MDAEQEIKEHPYTHIQIPKVIFHQSTSNSDETQVLGLTIDVETIDEKHLVWNLKAFSKFVKKHLVTYCFPPDQCNVISPEEVAEKYEESFEFLRKYCQRWKQDKNSEHLDPDHTPLKGVLGEWFLHAFARELFETNSLYSKVYLHQGRSAVHGFDLVHFKENNGEFSLWLGEAKFYGTATKGINAALESLKKACSHEYLKSQKREEEIKGEIAFISRYSKTQNHGGHTQTVKKIHKFLDTVTRDEFLKKITIPVLLVLPEEETQDLSDKTRNEIHNALENFCTSTSKNFFETLENTFSELKNIDIRLLVLPLGNYECLVKEFEKIILGVTNNEQV